MGSVEGVPAHGGRGRTRPPRLRNGLANNAGVTIVVRRQSWPRPSGTGTLYTRLVATSLRVLRVVHHCVAQHADPGRGDLDV
jgi:hypothetical protein